MALVAMCHAAGCCQCHPIASEPGCRDNEALNRHCPTVEKGMGRTHQLEAESKPRRWSELLFGFIFGCNPPFTILPDQGSSKTSILGQPVPKRLLLQVMNQVSAFCGFLDRQMLVSSGCRYILGVITLLVLRIRPTAMNSNKTLSNGSEAGNVVIS